MTWRNLVLGDSLELLIDNRGKNPPFEKSGVPAISGMSVKPGRIDFSEVRRVSEETWKKWMPEPTRRDDLILTSEAPLGRVAPLRDDSPVLIAQRVYCLRGQRGVLDSKFLYYAFQTDAVQADLSGRASGTTVLGIRQPELRKVVIPAPGYDEQRAIAEVLRALDDKIAANSNLIACAERLAIAYASGATRSTEVGRIAIHSTRSSSPERFHETVAHYSLPAFDSGAQPSVEPAQSIKSNKFTLTNPSVLISKLNPRIPRVWNIVEIGHNQAVASTEFVVLEPNGYSTSVLWSLLCQPEVMAHISSKVAGTSGSHQRVRPAEILKAPVGDPESISTDVRDLIDHLGRQIDSARNESRILAKTRDELLPLLMSGKLRVKDAEKKVEEIV